MLSSGKSPGEVSCLSPEAPVKLLLRLSTLLGVKPMGDPIPLLSGDPILLSGDPSLSCGDPSGNTKALLASGVPSRPLWGVAGWDASLGGGEEGRS
jgi:hypothetical protein